MAAGALARALGVMTAGACSLGLPAPDEQLRLTSEALLASVAASSKRANAAAAKAGSAAGLAALLGAPALAAGAPDAPSFLLHSQHHALQAQCLQVPHLLPWQSQRLQTRMHAAAMEVLHVLRFAEPMVSGDENWQLLIWRRGVLGGLLQELEQLATRESDSRVRRPAAAALALACYAIRRGPSAGCLPPPGGAGGGVEADAGAAVAAGLRLLPESGAMRALAERLLDDSLQPRPGPHLEAAILRALASVERLPELPWAPHVEQLLKRYPGTACEGPQGDAGLVNPPYVCRDAEGKEPTLNDTLFGDIDVL